VLASTYFEELPNSVVDTEFGAFHKGKPFQSADRLAHFAGRSCYQSWQMPNPDTSTDMGYMANIIEQGHFSVLEHASVTFYVEGVSRNMTHELIRHRHLSYSELSQRYVDVSDMNFIVPPAFGGGKHKLKGAHLAIEDYEYAESELKNKGFKGKALRQAARYYLPSGMETKIVVSGNHRAWRDMLHKRYSVHADAEIREFATLVLAELRKIAPATYQDFPDEPFA
jgi:thymidylate synthase (FAD)